MKCHLAMIHILTMLLDKANIKQQVKHSKENGKTVQNYAQARPGVPWQLLPVDNREILLFAQIIHRFIAFGYPTSLRTIIQPSSVCQTNASNQNKISTMSVKGGCGFQYSLGYKCSCRVMYLLWVKSLSD